MADILTIGKCNIESGESKVVKLEVGRLPSDTRISIHAHVFRSKNPGPTSLVLAGIHGDEINGIEIARKLIASNILEKIAGGTVIVIPILNIYGFINFDRYVPDGKDVNRSFPGTTSGSLASQIARALTKNIIPLVDYIFDFHTAGDSRYNYPQVRYSKKDTKAYELAKVFNVPFMIQSGLIPKSLRKVAQLANIPILVYEGGESIRINKNTIESGYTGLLRCLHFLGHLKYKKQFSDNKSKSIHILKTQWLRASFSGIFLWHIKSGEKIKKGDKLGEINDPNGRKSVNIIAKKEGYIIGHNNASVVNQGDALFHIGYENIF